MHTKNVIIFLIFVMGVFSASIPAIAAPPAYNVVYVDDTGLGGDHFDTIGEALAGVSPGGTVHIAAGHYIVTATINVTFDVTIVGEGADVVLIDAAGGDFDIFHVSGADFEISGCSITDGRNGILVETTENEVTIFDNHIYDNDFCGISVFMLTFVFEVDGDGSEYEYLTVYGNEIDGNARQGLYIFCFNGQKVIDVFENYVHDNGYAGIEFYGDLSDVSASIHSNTICSNGSDSGDTGIGIYDCMGLSLYLEIYDNEIYDDGGNGIHVACQTHCYVDLNWGYFSDYISIHDNEIYLCEDNGIYLQFELNVYAIAEAPFVDGDLSGYSSHYVDVCGNTIDNNGDSGILLENDMLINPYFLVVGSDEGSLPIDPMMTIAENEIFENGFMGVSVAGSIDLNKITEVPLDGDGIEIHSEFLWIYRNEIYGNYGGGIMQIGIPGVIENNLIAGNLGLGGLDGQFMVSGILAVECIYSGIFNNTIIANLNGIVYDTDVEIVNNIVAANATGICEEGGSCRYLGFNDVWDNDVDYLGLPDPTGTEGNISEDPLFYGMYDARLDLSSPCVDTGNPDSTWLVTEDIDGTPRPQGSGIDMGCYEMPANGWSPRWITPLATLSISKANVMWGCIMENLPENLNPEVIALMDEIQALIGQATSLANPVLTNGLMQQALELMAELSGILGCECGS